MFLPILVPHDKTFRYKNEQKARKAA